MCYELRQFDCGHLQRIRTTCQNPTSPPTSIFRRFLDRFPSSHDCKRSIRVIRRKALCSRCKGHKKQSQQNQRRISRSQAGNEPLGQGPFSWQVSGRQARPRQPSQRVRKAVQIRKMAHHRSNSSRVSSYREPRSPGPQPQQKSEDNSHRWDDVSITTPRRNSAEVSPLKLGMRPVRDDSHSKPATLPRRRASIREEVAAYTSHPRQRNLSDTASRLGNSSLVSGVHPAASTEWETVYAISEENLPSVPHLSSIKECEASTSIRGKGNVPLASQSPPRTGRPAASSVYSHATESSFFKRPTSPPRVPLASAYTPHREVPSIPTKSKRRPSPGYRPQGSQSPFVDRPVPPPRPSFPERRASVHSPRGRIPPSPAKTTRPRSGYKRHGSDDPFLDRPISPPAPIITDGRAYIPPTIRRTPSPSKQTRTSSRHRRHRSSSRHSRHRSSSRHGHRHSSSRHEQHHSSPRHTHRRSFEGKTPEHNMSDDGSDDRVSDTPTEWWSTPRVVQPASPASTPARDRHRTSLHHSKSTSSKSGHRAPPITFRNWVNIFPLRRRDSSARREELPRILHSNPVLHNIPPLGSEENRGRRRPADISTGSPPRRPQRPQLFQSQSAGVVPTTGRRSTLRSPAPVPSAPLGRKVDRVSEDILRAHRAEKRQSGWSSRSAGLPKSAAAGDSSRWDRFSLGRKMSVSSKTSKIPKSPNTPISAESESSMRRSLSKMGRELAEKLHLRKPPSHESFACTRAREIEGGKRRQ